jgi:N-acetylglucosaminyldiphosphoundecaprenol N-acetyl-beta-D-mannosaminyltransferase
MEKTFHPQSGKPSYGGQKLAWVGDVPVVVTDIADAAQFLTSRECRGGGVRTGWAVRLVGAKEVALASRDAAYRDLLASPGINFPDGLPVVWVMKLRSRSLRHRAHRVRGATLFRTALDSGRAMDVRHFFLGTTPETLTKLITATETAYPGLQIVGSWAPPFAPLDEEFFRYGAEVVTQSRADVVWVGLGAPKQDEAVVGLADRVDATFVAVGAAFDFLAGTMPEAPLWLQNSGLEWAFRLGSDPRRLWRRYLIGNAVFLSIVVRRGFGRKMVRHGDPFGTVR